MNFALGLWDSCPTQSWFPVSAKPTPSSIVVAWETKGNSTECVVEYGTTENLGRSASGTSQTTVEGHLVHHVTLNDLPPDSRVWYQVKTGDAVHGVHVFRTPLWPVMKVGNDSLPIQTCNWTTPTHASTKRWLNRASCHGPFAMLNLSSMPRWTSF